VDEDNRIALPYVQQYMLGVEHQFFRDFVFKAYYVGSRGVDQLRSVERNPGFTIAALAANPGFFSGLGLRPVTDLTGGTIFRPDPTAGSIMSIEPSGLSRYNSGQFTLTKRYSWGVQFNLNYTYSSYISDSDTFLIPASNPFDTSADRARSAFDQPHRFVADYIFQVPFFEDKGLLTRLLGGWELAGVTTVASGMPFTVYNAQNAFGLLPGQFTTLVPNQRAFTGSGGSFQPIPANAGVIGNLGRNTFRTGKISNTDLALVKSIQTFSENQALQLRGEVFNVFNHRSLTGVPFNLVDSDLDTFRFLNQGQTYAPGRTFMFTARYLF
jgi:hypothetical protein